MTSGDEYRLKAAELRAKATQETSSGVRTELSTLAAAYMRLADQAERNTDAVYETPPPKKEVEPN
jgi:hypothetical protein